MLLTSTALPKQDNLRSATNLRRRPLQRCLAKDPRDLYGSAIEVAKELVPTLALCAGFEARHGVTTPDTAALGKFTVRRTHFGDVSAGRTP
jgi:hypothetical protein